MAAIISKIYLSTEIEAELTCYIVHFYSIKKLSYYNFLGFLVILNIKVGPKNLAHGSLIFK